MEHIKLIDAKQGGDIHQYKNIKQKVLKTIAANLFNKCLKAFMN
jgi:hypothetical protein